MPYPALPADYSGPAWVTCPNGLYDPALGHDLYHRYIDELVAAEDLGFDGVCVNEHHQNAYGNMPSPNLIAAILARQTSRVKIAVVGNALPLYDPPTRVAEEYAMIDVISGGRLIAGFVVGGGPEYFSSGVNPAEARERFREAHDVILEAWTRPGPFAFEGRYYRIRVVNPWPRPLQQPHPEIWIPGVGSAETIEFVAARRYGYMGIPYFHFDVFEATYGRFREACRKEGYEADPSQMGFLAPIYVSDTDASARAEFESHFWYFIHKLLPGITQFPPGYFTPRSLPTVVQSASAFITSARSWDELIAGRFAIVGSPGTVAQRITEDMARLGSGNLLGLFQIGTLPADLTRQSMGLFAEQVMPKLRAEFGADATAA